MAGCRQGGFRSVQPVSQLRRREERRPAWCPRPRRGFAAAGMQPLANPEEARSFCDVQWSGGAPEDLHEIPASRLALSGTDSDLGHIREQQIAAMPGRSLPTFHHAGGRIGFVELVSNVLRDARERVSAGLDPMVEAVAVENMPVLVGIAESVLPRHIARVLLSDHDQPNVVLQGTHAVVLAEAVGGLEDFLLDAADLDARGRGGPGLGARRRGRCRPRFSWLLRGGRAGGDGNYYRENQQMAKHARYPP